MALFRRHRRQRSSDNSKATRRESRSAQALPPLLERLREIAATAGSPEDALEPALRAIVESTNATAGALCLFDQRHSVLRLTAEVELSDEGCRRLRTIRRGDPSCWDIPLHGVVNRRAYLIENASQNRYVPDLVGKQGMRTIACIPVHSGVMPLASLVLVTAPPRAFVERDITALWKPLRELASMIEAVRKQAAPMEDQPQATGPAPLDLLALAAERDRLRAELAGRAAEFERLTTVLATSRSEVSRLNTALDAATSERSEIARELERVRAESEETTTLAQALADAERERQRLVVALDSAAGEAEAREQRALVAGRHEAEAAAIAREAEWEAARRTHAEQLAAITRLAEERSQEIARLTVRLSEVETGTVADRGRDHRREAELARLGAALDAAASRETDLRARLAAREAERLSGADAELTTAREALETAEAARARAEERAASVDAELAASRRSLEELTRELEAARTEIAALRETERAATVGAEERQAALAEAQSLEAEARSRLEVAERVLAEMAAERDRAHEEVRGQQTALARAEARVEAIAAERDQLREALARSEAECARLRTALEAARSEDARVEALLAQERAGHGRVAERLAEAEAAIVRLEAIAAEQRTELTEREAEIVRLTAEHTRLLAEQERLAMERTDASSGPAVDTADLEAAAIVAPDTPATITRSEASVTVINVHAVDEARTFTPTGAPIVVVLDGEQAWQQIAVEEHDVAVIRPGASSVNRIVELAPARVIANLTAPGALTSLIALRAGGATTRFWGCIADAATGRAIPLAAIEPIVGPIDPDAVMGALGSYAGRDGRIVTAGADVDALMSLRQALSRRRASVSMAWDAKQASEMLSVVRPHAVVIDLSMPKRDGCTILASLAALDPVPLAVLVTGPTDPAPDFTALLGDPPRDAAIETLSVALTRLATYSEESLPQVAQRRAAKLQVAQGPRWVG